MPRTADRLGYIKYINICYFVRTLSLLFSLWQPGTLLDFKFRQKFNCYTFGFSCSKFFTYDMKTKWGIFLRLGSICSEAKIKNFLVSELVKDLWARSHEGHHLCTNQNSKGQKPVSVPGCKSTGPRTEPAPLEWSRSLALCSAFSALLTDPPLIAAERKKKG